MIEGGSLLSLLVLSISSLRNAAFREIGIQEPIGGYSTSNAVLVLGFNTTILGVAAFGVIYLLYPLTKRHLLTLSKKRKERKEKREIIYEKIQ